VWAPSTPEKKKATPKKGATAPATPTAKRRTPGVKANETILSAQEALSAAGYNLGEPDGKAGASTTSAVKRFQTDRHLPVTGKLDAITLAALGVRAGAGPADAEQTNLILADAVHTLVHMIDSASGQPGFLAATNNGLYRSLDPAKGWQKLSYGLSDQRTTCIATTPKDPETIWVGTPQSGALVSRDSGKTWRNVEGVPRDVPINVIAQDPQRPDRIYIGTKQAFFMSHDGGNSWSRRGGNLPFGDFTSILINPRNGDEVFAGNAYQQTDVGGGVFRTTDGGKTWARIDPKGGRLPSQRIWALAFDSTDQNVLFVGSHSAGVYVVPRMTDALSSAQ